MSSESTLHGQDTDYEIVKILLPFIKSKYFIDIGAEKGTFGQIMMTHGLNGILFEPLPKHTSILQNLTQHTSSQFSPYAISDSDREASFHIAYDEDNNLLDYFHSLCHVGKDNQFNHQQSIPVQCRSLNSLYREGVIPNEVGILKTDTEGNDLFVLKGAEGINAEVLICEYFMPGIYNGWEAGHPNPIIQEAKKLGFNHYIAIKRYERYELLTIDAPTFIDKQWGNLVFINDALFEQAKNSLYQLVEQKDAEMFNTFVNATIVLDNEITLLRKACEERLTVINELYKTKNFTLWALRKWYHKIKLGMSQKG